MPDDGALPAESCGRLAAAEFAAGARLRTLAGDLARREDLEISAVAHEESLELEVVVAGDRLCEPVSIGRDGTGQAVPGVVGAVGRHRR